MIEKIAKLILKKDLINYGDLKSVLQKNSSSDLEDFTKTLVNSGLIDKETLNKTIKTHIGADFEDLKDLKIDDEILEIIDKETVIKNELIPLRISDSKLLVAMKDPSDISLIDDLSFETGYIITPVLSNISSIRKLIKKNYTQEAENNLDFEHSEKNTLYQDNDSILIELEKYYEEIKGNKNPKTQFENEINDISVENHGNDKQDPQLGNATDKIDKDVSSSLNNNLAPSRKLNFKNQIVNGNSYIAPIEAINSINEILISGKSDTKKDSKKEPFNQQNNNKHDVDSTSYSTKDFINNDEKASEIKIDNILSFNADNSSSHVSANVESIIQRETANDNTTLKPTTTRTILIVDNSKTMASVIASTLEKNNYNVMQVGDAISALAKINDTKPDLILIEIAIPHMSGYQLCKILKRNNLTKDIPIILMSGKEKMLSKIRSKLLGAKCYITKPFGLSTLLNLVEQYAHETKPSQNEINIF